MSANVLVALAGAPSERLTHGGPKTVRSLAFWVNGVQIEEYHEGSMDAGWGVYFDQRMNERRGTLERALRCKAINAKQRRAQS